jgi:hypothetical protein
MADTARADLAKALRHHHARPWLALAAEIPATICAHDAWGHSPVAAVGLTIASGALTAATWWAGHGSSHHRRVHATATTGVACLYTVAATYTDPLSDGMLSLWAIGGVTIAATWTIRKSLRVNPDTKQIEKGPAQHGILTKAVGEAKVLLRGTPKVEPNKVTAELQLAPGQVSTDELGSRIKHIAAELGVSPNSVRIIPDPDRADRATLVVVPQDMLKTAMPWPGPSALGGSITDPIVLGIYEDGEQAVLWFPWAPGRNATHYLTAGMNGSGKSAGMSVAATEVLTRYDVIMWAIDPSKGLQTFAPFLPHLDWVEMSMSGGEAMISALGDVITARANAMGQHGFKNWTPEVFAQLGMPYMVVWIEEAAKFFRDGTEMEGLVMEARSAGISVIISLQRPSATSMPTDVREQLGGSLVFGVKGATTADMALPDDVRDAGARPEAWQNRRPGYAYLVAPGIDEERYPFPMRTYLISDDDIEGALALATRPTADPITATAAGPAYADRGTYSPDSDLTSTDTPKAAVDDTIEALDQAVERDLQLDAADDDGSPAPDVDPDQEIPPSTTVWTFGAAKPAPEDVSTQDALVAVMALLEEWRTEGRKTVGPRDFYPHLNMPGRRGRRGRIGRSRSWLSPVLAEIADQRIFLRETGRPGEYELLHPVLQDA